VVILLMLAVAGGWVAWGIVREEEEPSALS
jgi:hypothetical protein